MTSEVKKFASDMTDDHGNSKKLPEVLASAIESVTTNVPASTAATVPSVPQSSDAKPRLTKVDDDEDDEDEDYVPKKSESSDEDMVPFVEFVDGEAVHAMSSPEEEEDGGDVVDKSWIVDGNDDDPIEDEEVPVSLAESALARDIASRGFKGDVAAAILGYVVDVGIHEKIRDMMVAELDEKRKKKDDGVVGAPKKCDPPPRCPLVLDDFLEIAVAVGVLEYFHREYNSTEYEGDSKFKEYSAKDQKFSKTLERVMTKRRDIEDAVDRMKRKIRSVPAPVAPSTSSQLVYYRDSSNDGSADSSSSVRTPKEGFGCDMMRQAVLCYSMKVFSFVPPSGDAKLDGIRITSSREGVTMRLPEAQIVEMKVYSEFTRRGYTKCYVTSLAMARIALLIHRVVRVDDPMIAKHFKKPPKLSEGTSPMDQISAYIKDHKESFVSMWTAWKKVYDILESDIDHIQRASS